LSLSAYRNAQKISIGLTGLDIAEQQSVEVVQASDLVRLGSTHTLRLGVEYRSNSATSEQFFHGTMGYQASAASLMWNWQIAPALAWTNAVRGDFLKLNYSGTLAPGSGVTLDDYHQHLRAPSFNSGLVYNLTQKDTLRLMLARGVQLPSLVNFGLQFPFGVLAPAVIAGNPGLRASTVDSVELSYDRALPSLASSMRIAVYAQRNKDLISARGGGPPIAGPTGLPVLKAANVGGSDATGFDIGLNGHAQSGLRWDVSYAYVVTTDDTQLNQGEFVTSPIDYAHSTPRHVVLGKIGYTRGPWEMDLLARWQSSYRDVQSTQVPVLVQPVEVRNYLLLTGRIGYRLNEHLSVALSVQHFNSARQLQTAGPPVERRAIFAVSAEF
jgi:outer membrane receptor for ferrienterochelin and colicins